MTMSMMTIVDERAEAPAPLRLFRPALPATALGLSVSHLMTKPAFARQEFGTWSRVLVGQINRGHYHLVLDDRDRIVGFLGWALTSEANAEAWLSGRGSFSDAESNAGDCVVFNAWAADNDAVNRLILRASREVVRDHRLIYFKRHYPDGRARATRMAVNAFVGAHLPGGASDAPREKRQVRGLGPGQA
jgi:hemolysin-activating ACP:hemolysin acyltransferase